MKFLLDVCAASLRLRKSLPAQGHDALSAMETNPRVTDEELLALAMEESRVLVTEDKDFGELVFVRWLPHPCILRFGGMTLAEKVTAMQELIDQHRRSNREGGFHRGNAASGMDTSERARGRRVVPDRCDKVANDLADIVGHW